MFIAGLIFPVRCQRTIEAKSDAVAAPRECPVNVNEGLEEPAAPNLLIIAVNSFSMCFQNPLQGSSDKKSPTAWLICLIMAVFATVVCSGRTPSPSSGVGGAHGSVGLFFCLDLAKCVIISSSGNPNDSKNPCSYSHFVRAICDV